MGLPPTKTFECAYTLACLWERSGMCGAVSTKMMNMMAGADFSDSANNPGGKLRISKSLTKENRGQAAVVFSQKGHHTSCLHCKKTKKMIVGEMDEGSGRMKKMNKCSGCRFV